MIYQDQIAGTGFTITVGPNCSLLADTFIGAYKVVKVTNTGCGIADNTNPLDSGKVVGITKTSTVLGNFASIYSSGEITNNSWNFTVGPVYLGVGGDLTQELPANGFIQQIGTAATATKLVVNLQEPDVTTDTAIQFAIALG